MICNRRFSGRLWAGALAVFALLAAAPGPADAAPQAQPAPGAPKKLRVVTSILPAYCLASAIAGDRAEVENLLRAGVGAHDYQMTRRDVQRLAGADLIVLNGLGLENWLDRVLKSTVRKGTPTVRLADGLTNLVVGTPALHVEEGHTHEHNHGESNPHIWLDPTLAAHGVTNILRALQQADPANAAAYATNAAALVVRLHDLDAELSRALAPVRGRAIVTYHDAFPYFARRYGLNVVGVVEEVPEVNPSARYLARLGAVIRENKVPVVFTEAGFPSRLARRLRDDLKVAIAPLDTLETGPLTVTAYEDGMRRNLATLREHLR